MNVTIRRIEPTTTEPETWVGSPALDVPNVWEEETQRAEFQRRSPARRGHRLWLGAAVVTLLVGVGFVGRLLPESRMPMQRSGSASDATSVVDLPLTITNPETDATIKGPTIDVTGVTTGPVPMLHLGVVVGGAVIGSTTVRAQDPGPWSASIPIFAPLVTVEAELLASALAPGAVAPRTALQMRQAATITRAFTLHSNGPIELWPVTIDRSGTTTVVSVAGCAPLVIDSLTIALIGRDGRRLAREAARVRIDGSRPGSVGGQALGLGSFAASLRLPGALPDGPLRVAVDWRDSVGGEWGTAMLTILPDMPTRTPDASPWP